MANNLYQLRTRALPGEHVTIDGPHDKYGQVIKHQDSGYHLIRGLGLRQPPGIRIFIATEKDHP
jgi:hypothetical protein